MSTRHYSRYCEKLADKRIKCVFGDQSYLCIEGSRIELDYQVPLNMRYSRALLEIWEQRNDIGKVEFKKYQLRSTVV